MPEGQKPFNLVRQMAEEILPSVMENVGIEDTAANREDVLAFALNRLPSKYVNTGSGRMYIGLLENFRVQYETDVLMGLTRAAMHVKSNPRGSEKTGG